ncbi:WXG100 family type VII secretion target [Nonomuraea sp. NPDC003804]|uniref:WXG100 family type VII secretion target n=1 Tax=Nonomuraea sp. NPDC003804 TaxID=3154547 RepID=UPI0033A4E5FE
MADINFYQASRSQIIRARDLVVAAHEEIEGLRQAVIMTGENLASGWAGKAAESFGRAMIDWDDNMRFVRDDLFKVGETLGANAEMYQKADDEADGANFVQGLINR